MPSPAIALREVVKRFGDVVAVDHLDLTVPAGVCFGLLGPNGAGKSTIMRLLTGQAVADDGEVRVLGHRLPEESRAARSRCGVVPQIDDLDDELTVAENLFVHARLHRLPPARRAQAVRRGLERVELVDRARTPTSTLSGGMRRRLLIARGLLHDPELVLLDEPTVGLDPQIRAQLWTLIADIRRAGATVVMSTHYIEEAERLCDLVAIVHAGRVVAHGPPPRLVERVIGGQVVEVVVDGERLRRVEEQARARGVGTRPSGTGLALLGSGADGVPVDGLRSRRRPATLEDAFVALTGREPT